MQNRTRMLIAWLIIFIFIAISISSAQSDLEVIFPNEPEITDNHDGNWTARWKLKNADNFSLNDIELVDGDARLKKEKIILTEDDKPEFMNGTLDGLKYIKETGLGLDLRRNFITLIADRDNNRVVEIDYDKWVWQYGSNTSSGSKLGLLDDPTFAVRLDNNMTLITDKNNNRVLAVGRNNEFYWQYGSNNTGGLGENLLSKPSSALPTVNGNILISDTDNNYVVEVSTNKKIIWQYGYSSNDPTDWKSETSLLSLPTYVEEQPNGFVLITDHNNHRVILVDRTKTIRWQYGSTGIPGSNNGKLDSPSYATRMSNGNTLITDTKNHRVIEVNALGTIKWQYGKTKVPGSGRNELNFPRSAIELKNGHIMITDTGNHRTMIVNKTNNVLWNYGNNGSSGYGKGYLNSPTSAFSIKKNILVGYFISQVLDGFENTNWETISWEQTVPTGTMTILYSRTGTGASEKIGSWSDWCGEYINSTGENISSPINRYIQYAVVFLTVDPNVTPVISSVEIKGSRFENSGELRTESFKPDGLLAWISFNCDYQLHGQAIQAYYSVDQSSAWNKIYNNSNLSDISIESGGIRFRFLFTTTNISKSPILCSFSLVFEMVGELNNIEVYPNSTNVEAGSTFNFTAFGYDLYNHEIELDPIWTTTVGEMDNSTLIASTKVSNGFVNASEDGKIGSSFISVIPGPLHHIKVIPDNVTILNSETQEFTAFGYDRYNNEVQVHPIWLTDVGEMRNSTFIAQNFEGVGTVIARVGDIVGIANVTINYNSSLHHPPEIQTKIPNLLMKEDAEPLLLNLASYEFDLEDNNSDLVWYITDVNRSLYTTTGSYSDFDIITFIPKPNAFGTDQATIWLVDSDAMTASQNIWVNITPVNDKPVIEKIPDLYLHYDDPYTFNYSSYIHDIETPQNKLTLAVIEPPDQKYTSVECLNVTYDYPIDMFGETQSLTLSVSDGEVKTEKTFNVEITDNHAPKLIKPFAEISLQEGETLNYCINLEHFFTDQDGDKLTFFFNAQFVAVVLHENNTITISSIGTWSGIDIITFRAVDPFGAMAEGSLKITVLEVNNPPTIKQIPDIYLHYDYDYQFNLTKYIIDPDNDTSEINLWTSDPQHISFPNEDNNIMLLNYPESYLGKKIPVILNASDGLAMDWCQFYIHITDNFPPTFNNNLFDIYFDEDTSFLNAINLTEHFNDIDDAQLLFSILHQDSDNITVMIEPDNQVSFYSKKDWFGTSQVFFKAVDHAGAFVEVGIDVIVIPINDPPIINDIPTQEGFVGERWVVDLAPYINDIDNNITDLEIQVDSDFVTVTGTQLTFYPYKETDSEIKITISDGYLNTSRNIKLKIMNAKNQDNDELLQMIWFLILLLIFITICVAFVVYRTQQGSFKITDAFLIHKNGVLIKYQGETLKEGKDEDIIGSMLTAVQTFITDSFADGSSDAKDDWGLNQLRLGKNEIFIERGENIYIAVIYKGRPGKRLPNTLKNVIFNIEKKYRKILYKWNGSYKDLKGIESFIEPIILTQNDDIDNVSSKPELK